MKPERQNPGHKEVDKKICCCLLRLLLCTITTKLKVAHVSMSTFLSTPLCHLDCGGWTVRQQRLKTFQVENQPDTKCKLSAAYKKVNMLVCNQAVITTGDCYSHSELPKVSFTQANINTYLGHSNNKEFRGFTGTTHSFCSIWTLLRTAHVKKVTASIMTENRIAASLAVSKQ